jgi:predicted ribosomally synthesized peptide with SipW-like signal peptide
MQQNTLSLHEDNEIPDKRGRVRAILAAGLVLGLGATITLAAWNDSEFVRGTFTAGTFNLVGSSDGTTYANHATVGAPATLAFTLNPTDLSPGDVVYAAYAVELDSTTSSDAVVTIANASTSGTVTDLTYSLVSPSAFGCDSATTGTELVAAGTGVNTVPSSPTFALTHGTSGDPGDPVFLCFTVTAGSGLTQGQTGSTTWQFTATSQ